MKILYAIQATGNGHISRATQLLPYLKKYGEVDTFLSGSNATLKPGFDVNFTSRGLSLFYRKCGGLHYSKMYFQNSIIQARKDAKSLPVEKYDLVLNDFDYVTSLACKMKSVKSIQFGHQASFISDKTPRPNKKSTIGEYILKNYAKADQYVGLHFDAYDKHILPPVIKTKITNSDPIDKGHIIVYLPSFDSSCIRKHFLELREVKFEWFTHDVTSQRIEKNITYCPIDNSQFTQSLITCHGLITGGGFETPSEALYLNKRLMCIPIRSHYEQNCNAAALERLGVTVLQDIYPMKWTQQIKDWLSSDMQEIRMTPNDIEKTLDHIMELNNTME